MSIGKNGLFVVSMDKMLHDNYSCLVKSNKQQIKGTRSKTQLGNLEAKATPTQAWIHLFILCIVTTSLLHDRRIKMKESISNYVIV